MNRVIYNVTGQTLSHYPLTRVATATYVLERLDRSTDESDRTIASGSATVDSVSTTTDADAGPGEIMATKIPLTSTTSVTVGKRYEIEGADGRSEVIEVDGIVTDDYVLCTHPLVNDYTSGATFKGIEITASMDDTTAQDEGFVDGSYGPLRIVWKYTIDGVLRHTQEQVPVVRHTDGDMDIAGALVLFRDAFPEVGNRSGDATKLKQWAKFCARDLERRMRARGDDPALYLSGDQGTMALAWRVALHAAQMGLGPQNRDIGEWVTEAKDGFNMAWDAVLGSRAALETMDVDKGEDVAPNEPSTKARGVLEFG